MPLRIHACCCCTVPKEDSTDCTKSILKHVLRLIHLLPCDGCVSYFHCAFSYNGFEGAEPSKSEAAQDPNDSFGGFEDNDDYLKVEEEESMLSGAKPKSDAIEAPAWYAGKLGRKACEQVVTAGRPGDFVVRESSRGDKYVSFLPLLPPTSASNWQAA